MITEKEKSYTNLFNEYRRTYKEFTELSEAIETSQPGSSQEIIFPHLLRREDLRKKVKQLKSLLNSL